MKFIVLLAELYLKYLKKQQHKITLKEQSPQVCLLARCHDKVCLAWGS